MRKTVSVLLLIFLTLAVALFSFTSCKNEPELKPTEAPKPGEIPSIPNNLTTINSLSEEQTKALSTLFGDVGRFFVDYLDTYSGSKKPLYKLMNDPQFSFGETNATLSAAASSGTFGEGQAAKSYEHGAITGYLSVNDDNHIVLCADTVVTTELFDWTAGTKIHVEYNLIKEYFDIFIGEKGENDPFDIRCDDLDGSGYTIYKNGDDIHQVTDTTDKENLENKVNFLMFIALRALNGATIDFSDVTLSDVMDGDTIGDNKAIFTINGQVQLSGENKVVKVDDKEKEITTFDLSEDELSDIYSSLSVSVESLKVQAVVTTKVTTSEGDKSELLAATFDIEDLGLFMVLADEEKGLRVNFGCSKFSLSFSDKDENILLSLDLSNTSLDFGFGGPSNRPRLEAKLSTTLGLGLYAVGTATEENSSVENSIGLVTDFEVRTMGSLPFITIEPKAAVINGSFYNTKEIKDLLIDLLDTLLSRVAPS